MTMLKVFIGLDERQPVAANVLSHSIIKRSSVPVSITQLKLSTLPILLIFAQGGLISAPVLSQLFCIIV